MFLFGQRFNPVGEESILRLEFEPVRIMEAEASEGYVVSLGTLDARGFLNRLPPNLPMALGLRDIQGSDSLRTRLWATFEAAQADPLSSLGEPDPASPLLDFMGVRFLYTPRDLTSEHGLTLVSASAGNLYLNTRALPRAYVAASIRSVPTLKDAEAAVRGGLDPRRGTVVVAAEVQPTRSRWRALTVQDRGPNRLTIAGPLEPGDWVVLNDAFYPGWWAHTGAGTVPLRPANWALRAFPVGERAQQAEVAYLPSSFAVGQFVTGLSLGVLAFLLAFCRPARVRDEPDTH